MYKRWVEVPHVKEILLKIDGSDEDIDMIHEEW